MRKNNATIPEITVRLSKIIEELFDGNRSRLLEIINQQRSSDDAVSQQRFNRLFNIDTRTKKYPNLPSDIINAILECLPDVSKTWLLAGEGDMLISRDIEPKLNTKLKEIIPLGKHAPLRLTADQYAEAFGNWEGLPMYNEPITASFVETYRDSKIHRPQYYMHDPRFRDCDFGAIITGDSMHAEIRHGDFVACKEVVDRRFLVFGDIYYVVGSNGLETCKYLGRVLKDEAQPNARGVYESRDYRQDIISLLAHNKSVPPTDIPINMILRIYKVRGIVRGY